VLGVIQPAVAGQTITISVGGVPCAQIAGSPTSATGSFGIVVNCPAGVASLLVNGVRAGVSFQLVPGLTFNTNVYRSFVPAVSAD
jgi:hypothetical protein